MDDQVLLRGGVGGFTSDTAGVQTPSGPDGVPATDTGMPANPGFYSPGPFYGASEEYNPILGGEPLNPGSALQQSDTGWASNWQDYTNQGYDTGGGFWTMDQLYGNRDELVPTRFQTGSSLPSTNNYRLLPPDFRSPNFIMRNGQIIDLNSSTLHGPDQVPDSHYNFGTRYSFPSGYGWGRELGMYGWPGSLSGWTQEGSGAAG